MKKIFLIFVLFLVGCGKDNKDNSPAQISYSVDPELESYVDEFYSRANYYGRELPKNINVSFESGDLDSSQSGNQVGLCIFSSAGGVIKIQREFFDSVSILRIRSLIYHELGHCLLQRNHRTSTMWVEENSSNIRIPFSIMYPSVIPGTNTDEESFIATNFDFYFEEMFFPEDNEATFSMADSFVYDDSEDDLYYGATHFEAHSIDSNGNCNHSH